MKMFVANTTRQVVDFNYRLPENNGMRAQKIPVGQQIQLTGDLTTPQIDAVVKHWGRYGLVEVREIDRTKPFIGVCYSIDTPVPVSAIQRALSHNQQVLVDRGRETRKAAAIAESQTLNQSLEDNNLPADLRNLEMSVVEENPAPRGDGEEPAINEGVRVSNEEPEQMSRRAPTTKRGRNK